MKCRRSFPRITSCLLFAVFGIANPVFAFDPGEFGRSIQEGLKKGVEGVMEGVLREDEQSQRERRRQAPAAHRRLVNDKQVVRRTQQRLNQLGYDAGPQDGVYGPRTRRAIKAYQRDTGLRPTGYLSGPLVNSLAGPAPGNRPQNTTAQSGSAPATPNLQTGNQSSQGFTNTAGGGFSRYRLVYSNSLVNVYSRGACRQAYRAAKGKRNSQNNQRVVGALVVVFSKPRLYRLANQFLKPEDESVKSVGLQRVVSESFWGEYGEKVFRRSCPVAGRDKFTIYRYYVVGNQIFSEPIDRDYSSSPRARLVRQDGQLPDGTSVSSLPKPGGTFHTTPLGDPVRFGDWLLTELSADHIEQLPSIEVTKWAVALLCRVGDVQTDYRQQVRRLHDDEFARRELSRKARQVLLGAIGERAADQQYVFLKRGRVKLGKYDFKKGAFPVEDIRWDGFGFDENNRKFNRCGRELSISSFDRSENQGELPQYIPVPEAEGRKMVRQDKRSLDIDLTYTLDLLPVQDGSHSLEYLSELGKARVRNPETGKVYWRQDLAKMRESRRAARRNLEQKIADLPRPSEALLPVSRMSVPEGAALARPDTLADIEGRWVANTDDDRNEMLEFYIEKGAFYIRSFGESSHQRYATGAATLNERNELVLEPIEYRPPWLTESGPDWLKASDYGRLFRETEWRGNHFQLMRADSSQVEVTYNSRHMTWSGPLKQLFEDFEQDRGSTLVWRRVSSADEIEFASKAELNRRIDDLPPPLESVPRVTTVSGVSESGKFPGDAPDTLKQISGRWIARPGDGDVFQLYLKNGTFYVVSNSRAVGNNWNNRGGYRRQYISGGAALAFEGTLFLKPIDHEPGWESETFRYTEASYNNFHKIVALKTKIDKGRLNWRLDESISFGGLEFLDLQDSSDSIVWQRVDKDAAAIEQCARDQVDPKTIGEISVRGIEMGAKLELTRRTVLTKKARKHEIYVKDTPFGRTAFAKRYRVPSGKACLEPFPRISGRNWKEDGACYVISSNSKGDIKKIRVRLFLRGDKRKAVKKGLRQKYGRLFSEPEVLASSELAPPMNNAKKGLAELLRFGPPICDQTAADLGRSAAKVEIGRQAPSVLEAFLIYHSNVNITSVMIYADDPNSLLSKKQKADNTNHTESVAPEETEAVEF